MTKAEIMKLLPHRDDMLLLDDAEAVATENGGLEAVAHYTVRGDEFFLRGHFPDNPIVPGVILCEMLAQSACVLLKDALKEGKLPMYTGLDGVRFRAPVRPGDTVCMQAQITRAKPPFYFAEGSCSVGDRLCLTAKFSFAVTDAGLGK